MAAYAIRLFRRTAGSRTVLAPIVTTGQDAQRMLEMNEDNQAFGIVVYAQTLRSRPASRRPARTEFITFNTHGRFALGITEHAGLGNKFQRNLIAEARRPVERNLE